jgi:hypothetical protein
VFTHEIEIEKDQDIHVFSRGFEGKKTEELLVAGYKKVLVGLYYGDYYSCRDLQVA